MDRHPLLVSVIGAVAVFLMCRTTAGGVLHSAEFMPHGQQARQTEASRAPTSWQYARPAPSRPEPRNAGYPRPTAEPHDVQAPAQAAPSPLLFGHPAHIDPLFDDGTRPDWQVQHLERPDYERPTYDEPDRAPPVYRLESVQMPTLQRPLYVLPNDNRPNNNLTNYESPGFITPTAPEPVARGPNYVVDPEFAPGIDRPGYEHPLYDRPEYLGPDYEPQEYQPPQELPPLYIGPPR